MSDEIVLNDIQERFAIEYVRANCVNATRAARIADPDNPRPGRAGMEWLRNPDVAGRIAELVSLNIREKKGVRILGLDRKRTLLHDFAEDEMLEAKDRMKAIELDSKHSGELAPEKLELEGTIKLTGLFASVARGGYELDEYGERIAEAEVVPANELAGLLD